MGNNRSHHKNLEEELNEPYARRIPLFSGTTCMILALLSIIAGSLQLVHGKAAEHFKVPWHSGAPIWSGGVAFVFGLIGILLGLGMIPARSRRILFYCHFGFAIAVANTSGQALGKGIVQSYQACAKDSLEIYFACGPDYDLMYAMSLMALIVTVLILVCCIVAFVHYGVVVRRVYKKGCCVMSGSACGSAPGGISAQPCQSPPPPYSTIQENNDAKVPM